MPTVIAVMALLTSNLHANNEITVNGGEPSDPDVQAEDNQLTLKAQRSAAHKHLPLPIFVRVTNLSNRRSILVRVNDRGPFIDSRIIDLSAGAAKRLDFYKQGTARVLVETVELEG